MPDCGQCGRDISTCSCDYGVIEKEPRMIYIPVWHEDHWFMRPNPFYLRLADWRTLQ